MRSEYVKDRYFLSVVCAACRLSMDFIEGLPHSLAYPNTVPTPPALRVTPCFICTGLAPQSSLPNDTLMTFFIKLSLAFVEETQRHRHALTTQGHFPSTLKWWHNGIQSKLGHKTRMDKWWTTQHNPQIINTGMTSGQQCQVCRVRAGFYQSDQEGMSGSDKLQLRLPGSQQACNERRTEKL